MYRTYRNFHRTLESAMSMAKAEKEEGIIGGWYREATPEEVKQHDRQSAVNLHNGEVLMNHADSMSEALGG